MRRGKPFAWHGKFLQPCFESQRWPPQNRFLRRKKACSGMCPTSDGCRERFLIGMAPTRKIFLFSYPQFLREMNTSVERLLLPRLVPYQARTSGASRDRMNSYPDQLQIQKRSRWRGSYAWSQAANAATLASLTERIWLKIIPSTARRVTGLVWDLFFVPCRASRDYGSLVRMHHYATLFQPRHEITTLMSDKNSHNHVDHAATTLDRSQVSAFSPVDGQTLV